MSGYLTHDLENNGMKLNYWISRLQFIILFIENKLPEVHLFYVTG